MLSLLLASVEPPVPPGSELGTWILNAAVVILLLDRARAFFWPSKPVTEEFIRRSELDAAKAENDKQREATKVENDKQLAEIKNKLDNFVNRQELLRFEQQFTNLTNDHKELVKVTTARAEETTKIITDVRLSVEVVRREVHVEINAAVDKIVDRLLSHCDVNKRAEKQIK